MFPFLFIVDTNSHLKSPKNKSHRYEAYSQYIMRYILSLRCLSRLCALVFTWQREKRVERRSETCQRDDVWRTTIPANTHYWLEHQGGAMLIVLHSMNLGKKCLPLKRNNWKRSGKNNWYFKFQPIIKLNIAEVLKECQRCLNIFPELFYI